ncbi:uncharacterized protein F5891DRAFT_1191808 [Suillus fuscotomentosus]|uniref:Uncharacterized protein n=1 Tax=Suillus fuscotomentosus TaxID=1912939 RepID=A0AAD4E339_9AGAM|nr:uncharacterized protein F5891DRAFT_1191808 [Suillus fuscotomentosus]KAG1897604.1 hypothetical protein F5891DRAFT_1191808 [Suillus fuscotomentosus]
MTQTSAKITSVKIQDSLPPGYSAPPESLQPEHPEAPHTEEDFVEEQVGGGKRYQDPPVEHTPTKLHSHIKATNRDAGLVKEASMRQARLLNEEFMADSNGQVLDTLLADAEYSTPPQPVLRERSPALQERSVPPQPALRERSVPLQLPIQDVFYEAPLINSSENARPDGGQPPQPNFFTKPSFLPLEQYDFSGMMLGSFKNGRDDNHIAGSSTLLPAVPQTYITPPTPTGPAEWEGHPYTDDFPMDDAFDFPVDDTSDVVPAVKGRRFQTANAVLQEGFVELEHMIQDLSSKTAIPTHQIVTLWNKSHARSTSTVNHWNAYSSYFKDYLKDELVRLGRRAPEIHGTPSATVPRNCYELFKAAFLDKWQNILELHEQSVMLLGIPQTVAMWGQEFQKFGTKISGLMDSAAARYGFEAAFVVCGKVVNQDGSLGLAHTTPGAEGFWKSRCRADEDTIIGHLKAQVYNLTSLGVVEEAFDEDSIGTKANVRGASVPPSESLDISKHGIKWIKDELHRQIDALSGKLTSNKIFPWKTLPSELTRMSMIIKGYPEDVLLPGGFHTTINKGIANLTLKETSIVIAALKAGTMSIKKIAKAKQAKVLTSECPVVEGAPPAADLVHTAGCRLFVNGKSDRLGALHLKQSTATSIVKGKTSKKALALPASTTSLADESDDEPSVSAPVCPQPPPSREFKVIKRPTGQKKVDKEVISLASSDTPSGSEDLDENLEESVILDSDYQDDVSSKKWKAKSEGASRASKKRSLSVAPAEKAVSAKKTKGKVPVRPKPKVPERRALSGTAESSGDEHIRDVQAKPAKRLLDGSSAQEHPVTAVDPIMDNDVDAPDGSAVNKAAAETRSSNVDATNSLPTCPLPPSPTRHASVDLFPDNIVRAGSLAPASKSPVVRPPSLQRGKSLGPAAKSPLMQPPSLQPVTIHDQPIGRREPVMGMSQSHHEQRTDVETRASQCRISGLYPYIPICDSSNPKDQSRAHLGAPYLCTRYMRASRASS